MAFQKQFKTSYFSYNGWEYYLEIWVNDSATITASEVKLGTGGPIISYDTETEDRFSPIISSNCVVPLVIENTAQELFITKLRETYNERDVYIHLYKATEAQHSAVKPLWSGFVLMDLSSTPDEFYPYDIKLTAVDGLSLLKDIDFVETTTRRAGTYIQADMYYGPATYVFWIREILAKSGASTTTEGVSEDYVFTTAINWFESQMPTITQSTDPFAQTKCAVSMFHTKTDNDVFEVSNCYDVLKELLRHWGARMTYWKGQYWIVQIPEYNTNETGTYINPDNINTRTYSKTGAFVSSSDNLGDSYYTRYQLYIDNISGGIQKLTGTEINYLPQLREAIAQNISFGGGNRYGGFPTQFNGSDAQTQVVFQDDINDASDSDAINLYIPLDVTITQSWSFELKIKFNFYCTNGSNIYYLQYDPTLTFPYYWVISTQWTTLVKAPTWSSGLYTSSSYNVNGQSHTINGFEEQIPFKLYNTSTQAFSDIDLSGNYQFYLDIDNYGTNASNAGSFLLRNASAGLSTTFYYNPIHVHVNTTWTNTLKTGASLSFTNNSASNTSGTNNIIQFTSPNYDPFEGMLVVVTNSTGSIYGNSYVSSVNTSDVEIVDFGTLIWGDALQASDKGSLKVFDGSTFEKSAAAGNWGKGILTGTDSFTQILLDEYLKGQVKVIESPSMRLVTSEFNRESSDGSGLRPNFINPIGRLRENKVNLTDVQYIFKRGAFYTLTDEWDYEGYEIRLDSLTITKTVNPITGPNNPIPVAGSVAKISNFSNAFGQIISKQIITSTSSSIAAGAITSLPIALINDVVFKVGDFFNVLNSDTNEFIKFELNAQQFSDSSALTVVSKTITDNIPANSIITFNAFDLTSQYQNKTRGTVAGFDITATGIEKSSINITDWLNSDTMTGAAVTNVPTALSVKNYVDGQAGLTENFQTVTDNGNTTTNSIMIGSSSSPDATFHVQKNSTSYTWTPYAGTVAILEGTSANHSILSIVSSSSGQSSIWFGDTNRQEAGRLRYEHSTDRMVFVVGGTEKMNITSGGNVGISTSSPQIKLQVLGTTTLPLAGSSGGAAIFGNTTSNAYGLVLGTETSGKSYIQSQRIDGTATSYNLMLQPNGGNVGINQQNPTEKLHVVGDALITGDSHADAFKPASTGEPIKFKNFGSTELARITNGGILSINNTGEQGWSGSKLNVGDTGDSASGINILTSSSGNAYIIFSDVVDGSATEYANQIRFNHTDNFLATTISGSEKMRLTSGGNLGIGTSSPSSPLTVAGRVDFQNDLRLRGTDSASNQGVVRFFVDSNNKLFIDTANNGANLFAIDSSGQVTIPATPVATTDAASKSYVDAHGGGVGPFLPLVGGTLTGSLTGTTATFSGTSDGFVTLNSTDNGSVFMALQRSGTRQSYVGFGSNSNDLSFANETSSGHTLFLTNDTERARITSGGNVGIGNTSPTEALDVSGNITVGNNKKITFKDSAGASSTAIDYTSNSVFKMNQGNSGELRLNVGFSDNSNNKITFFTQGLQERMRVTNSGNLLLNTTVDLNSTLQINGRADLLNGNALRFFNSGNSNWSQITSSSTGVMAFNTGGVVNSLYLSNLGGIAFGGVSNYGTSGQVLKSNADASPTWVDASSVIGGPFLPLAGGTLTGNLDIDAAINIKSGSAIHGTITTSSNSLTFNARNTGIMLFQSGGSEKMRLLNNGNLGVGTSSPGYKLDINGTTRITGELRLAANINQYTGDFSIWVANVGQAFTIKPNTGNVLISSTSDNGQKLQVTGNVRITGSFQVANTGGFLLADTGGSMRYGLKYGAAGAVGSSNLLMLTNRSLSSATGGGEIAISANASTSGVTETEVMRIKANTQSQVSIDGVLSLTKQDTPVDPPNNASTIWLDSNWDLKIKITNSSGDTVTKTIVEYA